MNRTAEDVEGIDSDRDVPALDTRASIPNHGAGYVACYLSEGRVLIETEDDALELIVTDGIARKWTSGRKSQYSAEIRGQLDELHEKRDNEVLIPQ